MPRVINVMAMTIDDDMRVETKDFAGRVLTHNSLDDFLAWADNRKNNLLIYTDDMVCLCENMIYALHKSGCKYGKVKANKDATGAAPANYVYETIVTEAGVFYKLGFRLSKVVADVRDISALYTGCSIEDLMEMSGTDNKLDAILAAYKAVSKALGVKKPKLTIAAQAYEDFSSQFSDQEWEYYFPSLPDEVDEFIRRCYKGGLIIAPMPKMSEDNNFGCAYNKVADIIRRDGVDYAAISHSNRNVSVDKTRGNIYMCMTDHGKCYISDKNSMYPNIMVNEMLPYGLPTEHITDHVGFDKIDEHMVMISDKGALMDKWGAIYPGLSYEDAMRKERGKYYYVRFNAKIRPKDKHVPSVKWPRAKELDHTNYITDMCDMTEFYMSEDELDMLFNDYEVDDFEYLEAYEFNTTDKLFKRYNRKWYAIKDAAKGVDALMYKVAKLMINGLSGKFAQYDILKEYTAEVTNGRIEIVEHELKGGKPAHKYIPVAAAITAKGRNELSSLAALNYDILIGGDTDSIITSEMPQGITYSDKMGDYKLEHVAEHSVFIARKTYAYNDNGKWTIKCAGMGAGTRANVYKAAAQYDAMLEGSGYDGLGMLAAFAPGASYTGNIGFDRQPGVTRKITTAFSISTGYAKKYNVVDDEYYAVRDTEVGKYDDDEDLPF